MVKFSYTWLNLPSVECQNLSFLSGFPYLISKYAEDFGLVDEECFPYEAKDSPCHEQACPRHYGTGYHYVGGFYGACNEVLMRLELLKNGPITVAF